MLSQSTQFTTLYLFTSTVAVIVYFFVVSFYANRPSFFPKSITLRKEIDSSPRSATPSQHVFHKENNVFGFSNVTTLNFMHLHKTGGTSIKNAFHMSYNKCIKNSNATDRTPTSKLIKEGSCKERQVQVCKFCSPYLCSWDYLATQPEYKRNQIDITLGHQFLHGNESLSVLLSNRIVRSFTVLRHPFARKLSMFFHFLVRQAQLRAQDIAFDDIVSFLLHEQGNMREKGNKFDVGPNYYAGRLLADGYDTYYSNVTNDPQHWWFKVQQDKARTFVDQANSVLDSFALVGIYEWPRATQCVTKLMLQEFDEVLRIERIERGIRGGKAASLFSELLMGGKLNQGQYRAIRNTSSVWKGLSSVQQTEFREHESIDLQIYEHGVELFIRQVHIVGCASKLEEDLEKMERGPGAGDGDFDGLLSTTLKRYRRLARLRLDLYTVQTKTG